MLRLKSTRHFSTHIDLLVTTPMAIRLQQKVHPWTPWQRITIHQKDSPEEYLQEIKNLLNHTKTFKLYDKNSPHSIKTEKWFFKALEETRQNDQIGIKKKYNKFQLYTGVKNFEGKWWRPKYWKIDHENIRNQKFQTAKEVNFRSLKFKQKHFLADRTDLMFRFKGNSWKDYGKIKKGVLNGLELKDDTVIMLVEADSLAKYDEMKTSHQIHRNRRGRRIPFTAVGSSTLNYDRGFGTQSAVVASGVDEIEKAINLHWNYADDYVRQPLNLKRLYAKHRVKWEKVLFGFAILYIWIEQRQMRTKWGS